MKKMEKMEKMGKKKMTVNNIRKNLEMMARSKRKTLTKSSMKWMTNRSNLNEK